jgi:Ca-activated chloride channel family protein
VTADGTDVERIARRVERHWSDADPEQDEGRRRDEGWWLTWPIAACVALWFRRGWLVQWEV